MSEKEEAGIFIKNKGDVQIIHNSHGVFYLHLLETREEDGVILINEEAVLQTCKFQLKILNERIKEKFNEA